MVTKDQSYWGDRQNRYLRRQTPLPSGLTGRDICTTYPNHLLESTIVLALFQNGMTARVIQELMPVGVKASTPVDIKKEANCLHSRAYSLNGRSGFGTQPYEAALRAADSVVILGAPAAAFHSTVASQTIAVSPTSVTASSPDTLNTIGYGEDLAINAAPASIATSSSLVIGPPVIRIPAAKSPNTSHQLKSGSSNQILQSSTSSNVFAPITTISDHFTSSGDITDSWTQVLPSAGTRNTKDEGENSMDTRRAEKSPRSFDRYRYYHSKNAAEAQAIYHAHFPLEPASEILPTTSIFRESSTKDNGMLGPNILLETAAALTLLSVQKYQRLPTLNPEREPPMLPTLPDSPSSNSSLSFINAALILMSMRRSSDAPETSPVTPASTKGAVLMDDPSDLTEEEDWSSMGQATLLARASQKITFRLAKQVTESGTPSQPPAAPTGLDYEKDKPQKRKRDSKIEVDHGRTKRVKKTSQKYVPS